MIYLLLTVCTVLAILVWGAYSRLFYLQAKVDQLYFRDLQDHPEYYYQFSTTDKGFFNKDGE